MRSDRSGRTRGREGPAFAVLLVLALGCTPDEPVTGPAESAPRTPAEVMTATPDALDATLRRYLQEQGFTGRVAQTLESRLGRRIDGRLAELGRMLWFDPITALHNDNA